MPHYNICTYSRGFSILFGLINHSFTSDFLLQKNKIAKIGGTTYAKKTRNILKFILDDNVSKAMSWTGKKQFMPIKDTGFANIIISK